MIYYTEYLSPVGKLLIVSDGQNLTGLWIENQRFYPTKLCHNGIRNNNLQIFNQTKKWLDNYFAGNQPAITQLSLIPYGTPFRQKVWQILCQIPYGHVSTYGEIAKQITETGQKMSARAVGGAIGHNPISIIIPCHRIIGTSGKSGGYAGGLDIKMKLLELEGIKISDIKNV